jgi:formylglycine-generating enzyme required for sulfatase activity
MGSPEDEPERYEDESPQHEVTVGPFLMGAYPVTQGQWRVVTTCPVERELDPDPSNFKGDNRPVERVPWYDAVEFCARLSPTQAVNTDCPPRPSGSMLAGLAPQHLSTLVKPSTQN